MTTGATPPFDPATVSAWSAGQELTLDLIAGRSWLTQRRSDAYVDCTSRPYHAEIRLSLLGQWRLTIDDVPVPIPSGTQRLLARLALGGRQARVHIAGTLWSDTDDERALGRLRSVLWRLQRTSRHLVAASDGHLALGPTVRVDALDLAGLARQWTGPRDGVDSLSACDALRRLDAPDLLPGWYDDWVLAERDRLNQLRMSALECLADALVALERPVHALEAAMAAVRADPLRESAHRAAVRAHLAAGNQASAVRQFEDYRALLRTELGIDQPSEAMHALLADYLANR